jgi:hypothetical protein
MPAMLHAVRRVQLLRLSGTQSYGRPRGEIFTSAGTIIRLLPRSIRSVPLRPRISISCCADTTVRLRRREDHAYCRLLKRSPNGLPSPLRWRKRDLSPKRYVYHPRAARLEDVPMAIVDGLKGFPEAITAVFPQAKDRLDDARR